MACLEQVQRHWRTHVAKSDETYIHDAILLLVGVVVDWEICRAVSIAALMGVNIGCDSRI
jgi:hypothetical protein